jgi:SAM-dependent methyltransferase
MRRVSCSACASGELQVFLDLGESPIADAYTDKPDLDASRYPLEVAVCAECHLAQLMEVIEPEVLFGASYSFYSSDSPPLVAYHLKYAADLLIKYPRQAALGVLEIGCNDGDLLRHFAHHPHLGIDPTSGPITAATTRGLNVVEAAFSDKVAETVNRKFGLVIANHVLAHVADVSDVVAGIARLLHPEGVAFIEVQYLPDLLVNNAFDLVYHEHRNFFSLTSLEYALSRHGLQVLDAQLTDRQGGSLRITAGARVTEPGARPWNKLEVEQLRISEKWLSSLAAYEGMQGRAERIRTRIWDLLEQEAKAGRLVAGYAAPAKATTLLSYCQIGSDDLKFIMDPAPIKVGRYVPGTNIQIIAPNETMNDPNATVLLFAWNYASAIMRQYGLFSPGGGRWILPFPAPVLL